MYEVWIVCFGASYNRLSHWLTYYVKEDALLAAALWRNLGDGPAYEHYWAEVESRERGV